MNQDIAKLFASFLQTYDVEKKDAIWKSQSQTFRTFWNERIRGGGTGELDDPEIDDIVRILTEQLIFPGAQSQLCKISPNILGFFTYDLFRCHLRSLAWAHARPVPR
jgi:hypothetical protein